MDKVIWTEPAHNALDEIADYMALDNYDAACRLVRAVFKKTDLLAENPKRGSVPKTLSKTSYRRLILKPIHIYYRIENKSILVIYVERAERNFDISRLV